MACALAPRPSTTPKTLFLADASQIFFPLFLIQLTYPFLQDLAKCYLFSEISVNQIPTSPNPPRAVYLPMLAHVLWFFHTLSQWRNGKGNEKYPSANLKKTYVHFGAVFIPIKQSQDSRERWVRNNCSWQGSAGSEQDYHAKGAALGFFIEAPWEQNRSLAKSLLLLYFFQICFY